MLLLHIQLQNSARRETGPAPALRAGNHLDARWYAAYPLRLLNTEKAMAECGVLVNHASLHRAGAQEILQMSAQGVSSARPTAH